MSEQIQDETPAAIGQQAFAPGEVVSKDDQPERSEWNPMSAPATYALIAVNVAVYLWMITHHVSPTLPSNPALIKYGSNMPLLVLRGEWYRLVTATFVHIGIIHIATNMWCLWNLGLLGEPLLGPWGLIAVYLLTGAAGNLLSLGWNIRDVLYKHDLSMLLQVGAGASGAVFGIAGILIVLLSNRRLPIPWEELKRLRTSVVRFSVINLVIGAGTIYLGPVRVDNSAHLGGFLCGLALGPALLPRMTSGRVRYLRRQKFTFATAAFFLSLFGYWISKLFPVR